VAVNALPLGCSGDSPDGSVQLQDEAGATKADSGADALLDRTDKDGRPDGDERTDTDGRSDADDRPDVSIPACLALFALPVDGAKLTEKDDLDADDCANGFQYDVSVKTSASDGTKAVLLLTNGAMLGSTIVSAGTASFSKVQLDSKGTNHLTARIGTGNGSCSASASVAITCASVPTCSISKPAHDKLNGIAAASGGDRASAIGSAYQAAFEIATDAEDGQPVSLTIDSSPVMLTALASGGKAVFPGVTLAPDGDHVVEATCTGKSGLVGKSAKGTYSVDSTPPDLAVVSPIDGKHFVPSDDAVKSTPDLEFEVCGTTTAADAASALVSNFCAGIGSATPICSPMPAPAAGMARGCVDVPCPGRAPFDLNVSLKDAFGNATIKTVKGVSCSSKLPSVQIVDPTDGTGADVASHILSATANQARKDLDGSVGGPQYTVRACTDAATGKAQLLAGLKGATLGAIGQPIAVAAAQAGDGCPVGLGYLAKFSGVTLYESSENADGTLATPTELRVDVTDEVQDVGRSPWVDVWVDTVPPSLSGSVPSPFCGKLFQSATPVTTEFILFPSLTPVTMTVTHEGTTTTYTAASFSFPGQVSYPKVVLGMGANEIASTIKDVAGNSVSLPSACTITVGNPPSVTWVTPTLESQFNVSTDGDSAPGWQGKVPLRVHTDLGGSDATVQFAYEAGGLTVNLGAPVQVDGAGDAELASPSIPDGDGVKLIATTSSVPGRGPGSGVLSPLTIDTVAPNAVTGLIASVANRRQVTFHLGWVAPDDSGKSVYSYEVRVARSAIKTQADFDAAEAVTYPGTPAATGGTDSIDVPDRYIENNYYFAVLARDKAGNKSSFVAAGPQRASFKKIELPGGTNEGFGYSADGSSDINGDGLSDLVVGAIGGTRACLYFGKPTGLGPTPDVTFAGSVLEFGISTKVLGDIDGDGLLDIGVGSDLEQKVYIFAGKTIKAATNDYQSLGVTLTAAQAIYQIGVDASTGGDPKFDSALFGIPLARLGDFDGDGADDFAVGALYYNGRAGYLAVIYGGVRDGVPFPSAITLPQALGSRAQAVAGDVPLGRFGWTIVGLGRYYTGSPGTSLIASASRVNAEAGRVYAFSGPLSAATVQASSANHSIDGPAATDRLGYSMALLGNISGTPNPDVGLGAPSINAGQGKALLYFGSPSTGPFSGAPAVFKNSAASASGDKFGFAVIGGGFSGTTVTTSFIGNSTPDVAFSGIWEAGGAPKLYFVDGMRAAISADVAAPSGADVVYPLPANWAGTAWDNTAIKDLNGDGYGDIAVGEFLFSSPLPNGRLVVLW
jgi:hypothetical protein